MTSQPQPTDRTTGTHGPRVPGWLLTGMLCLLPLLAAAGPVRRSVGQAGVDYNRDVRPILATHCFSCHGFDASARKGGLRLDQADPGRSHSGRSILAPGRPEGSELLRRVTASDAVRRMPPPGQGRGLNAVEVGILRTWIRQGARFQGHWSFVPPKPIPPPTVRRREWPRNDVDRFILSRLERSGLSPSPEADRSTLLRRATLDLTGLPPSVSEQQSFESDRSPDAYDKAVDRLLASPRYGERMASDWLDLARYADTNGYQVDRDREMWPWRDWVIRAFNRDLPYDQFTIEQLAGDLLPNPTLDQRIATGFHRNHMLNEEGGIIPEEFLVEGVADRTETTAAAWMGLTLGCARCHDHKYDPFTQKEYYGLYAFFNSVAEVGVGNYGAAPKLSAPPLLRLPSPEQEERIKVLGARVKELEARLRSLPEGAEKKPHQDELNRARKDQTDAELQVPTLMVMEELPQPRETHVLLRGQYRRKGERVQPGTPSTLLPFSSDLPRNRLGLARWLVDPAHPLTARVLVNRVWQMLFGAGLSRTPEDFGTRGELPTHPDLLDHLAHRLVAPVESGGCGWSMKRLIRLIVTSATYRQSSAITPALRSIDPENRLLARAPRVRLPAETIRDQALAASGLLVGTIGGPSVRPYHPPGLYEQVAATNPTYVVGKGDDLHRRSLYTYWRRSVPHPAMLVFDQPFRETCAVRRSRTSTPLQALNLMNDPTYLEAARVLAERMQRDGGKTVEERLTLGFRLVLARRPRPPELQRLRRSLEQNLTEFRATPAEATAVLKVGERPWDQAFDPAETAAYALAAATILNLDEAITRE